MILADMLSRAFSLTVTETKFPDEVEALSSIDTEQTADMQMIASADMLTLIQFAAGDN